jgi:polysaccharide export outer membrane protein
MRLAATRQNRIVVVVNGLKAVCVSRRTWQCRLRGLGFLGMFLALLPASVSRAQVVPSAPVSPGSVFTGAPQAGAASQQQGAAAGQNQTGQNSAGQNQQSQSSQSQSSQTQTSQKETPEAARQRALEERTSDQTAEVPTEFQQLVQNSIGRALPIFGASLFNSPVDGFVQTENVPVPTDYVVGPGDELRIELYGQVNQQRTVTVDRSGDISYPDVGTVHVAGVPYAQLQQFLQQQLSRVYRNFQLNVNLGQLRSIQVLVSGYARRPGNFTVSSLSTLLNALFASGGPSPQGTLRDIELIRAGSATVHFDLYDLLLHGDKSHDVKLQPGDVIFIPPVGGQVAIAGSVDSPAIYETLRDTTVEQAIALAGGKTSVALGSQVRIDRIYQHAMRSVLDVDPKQMSSLVVENGDIVSVATILDRYRDAVTLRGNVAFPGRYVWRAGMKILDLVPSREQLITREYYRNRNALGNTALGIVPLDTQGSLRLNGGDAATQSAVNAVQSGNTTASTGGSSVANAQTSSNNYFSAQTDVVLSAPDLDWDYAVIERLEQQTLKTVLIPFNPGKLYKDGDMSQNLELESGDVVTFFSTADLKVPNSQQTRYVKLEGEFVASGVYSVEPGETLRHLLTRAGGFTSDAYLYGSEFTRQSTRRVQQQRLNEYADSLEAELSVISANSNARAISTTDAAAGQASVLDAREAIARFRRIVPLGRIVLQVLPDSRSIDSVPDLPLEDGDRFIVPRVPSTVVVEGQVYSANAFVFERGHKERDYLREAGGPDRNADRKRTFILRADGSVYSRQYGNVDKASIFPGDTVVVPPQLDRRALLRNLIDISTVVGQFGLGAAAVNVLR